MWREHFEFKSFKRILSLWKISYIVYLIQLKAVLLNLLFSHIFCYQKIYYKILRKEKSIKMLFPHALISSDISFNGLAKKKKKEKKSFADTASFHISLWNKRKYFYFLLVMCTTLHVLCFYKLICMSCRAPPNHPTNKMFGFICARDDWRLNSSWGT